MYAVEVSDQIMIAHSFRGELFGPAQNVHGATFVIRVAFLAEELDAHGIVVDIARAQEILKEALVPLNYRNLDELPQFKGMNTTTEFLTKYVFDLLAEAVELRLEEIRHALALRDVAQPQCGLTLARLEPRDRPLTYLERRLRSSGPLSNTLNVPVAGAWYEASLW